MTLTLEEIERIAIINRLEALNWNRTKACKSLGIAIRTLRNKIRRYRADGHKIP